MCNSLLPCPLCSVPRFNDLESLRVGLIKAATENLICPICKDVFMGLDKLTIHLFSHRESGLCTEKKKNITEPERQSAERKKSVDLFTNKTESQNEARESSFIKKKSKNKTKENNFNETSIDILNKSNNNNQNFPIFNMNALPFIGIPKNMPCEIQKNCRTRNSERRRNKNGLSEKCDICGFYFLGKNILEMHKKLIHNVHNSEVVNGVSQYCCHLCSKVFKMRGSLMVHLRMVHFRVIPSIENEESPVNYEENITKTENFNNDVMIQSNEINLPTKVEYEIANSEKLADSNEININGNKQWTCDICNKNFTTKYFLKKHKRLHTGEMPYSCVQCNKTFTFQQSYHKHLLYHNDDKPHTCSHCGRSFKELSTLHNHQRIHTGEKPFSCETCGKCFRQRVSYLVHRRIHTGVMPYKCTACDKSFRYKVSQRTHKCTAQPPGTVVRQSGDLVQKLIKNHIEIGNNTETHLQMSENFKSISEEKFDQHFSMTMNSSNENSISFSTMHQSDQFLDNVGHNSFSGSRDSDENFVDKIRLNEKNIIDEIVNESISKIDFSEPSTSHEYHNAVTDLYSMMSPTNDVEEDLPSPSEKLKDLKLSSPKENIAEGVDKK